MPPSSIRPGAADRPRKAPIGLKLASTAKKVSRAFELALAAVGGSRPSWLILISLKSRRLASQEELAAAVGIRGATLTHHLDALESDGILTRRRDPENRRVHLVELTPRADAAFERMRRAAAEFDRRLRAGLSESDVSRLTELLEQLERNVGDADHHL
jgi:MarR family transcriptional regulator for hemolysin